MYWYVSHCGLSSHGVRSGRADPSQKTKLTSPTCMLLKYCQSGVSERPQLFHSVPNPIQVNTKSRGAFFPPSVSPNSSTLLAPSAVVTASRVTFELAFRTPANLSLLGW